MKTRIVLTLVLLLFGLTQAMAQTTAFTFQGKLTDNGGTANGNYDLMFQLFDSSAVGTGAQLGGTLNLNSIPVNSGIFTVQLDFGPCASCFNGANRFLEIAVRPTGAGNFVTLSPRQPITSTPYAVKSMNSLTADGLSVTCASCVTSSQIQSVQGSQVTGNIPGGQINGTIPVASVPAGSASYIQNSNTPQPNSGFSITGDGMVGGKVGIGTASPQYKLHVVGQDVRVEGNTTSTNPRFSWFNTGAAAGSGRWHIAAGVNYLRFAAITDNDLGERTWLQVTRAGQAITNVIVPSTRVGVGLGVNDPKFTLHVGGTDDPNVRVESLPFGPGSLPQFSLSNDFGAVDEKKWRNYATSNTLSFSALNDAENQEDIWLTVQRTGASVSNVLFPRGIKITDPNPTLSRPTFRAETTLQGGTLASFGDKGDIRVDSLFTAPAPRFVIKENGRVGIGVDNPADTLDVFGTIRVSTLGLGGSSNLCINNLRQISGCSSSLRYKTDLHPFTSGLNLINRLHPLTFKWKADQSLDLGLGAEDVAAVEPLLVTHNANGEVEGVKYDRLSAVFINAFKEQQNQIEQQQAQIKAQESQINAQDGALGALRTRLASLEQAMRRPQHQNGKRPKRK